MDHKYDFDHYLKAGHGRAYLMAKKDPEKYRCEIFEACTKDYSFDLQSEGSRAYLTADLAELFEDRTPFIKAAEDRFMSSEVDMLNHDVRHLADFLDTMGRYDLIVKKYCASWEKLYGIIDKEEDPQQEEGPDGIVVTQRPDSSVLLENIEYLGIRIIQGGTWKEAEKVVSDMGEWCIKEDTVGKYEFPWFFFILNETFGDDEVKKHLTELAAGSEKISAFIKDAYSDEEEEAPRKPKLKTPPTAEELIAKVKADKDLSGIGLLRLGIRNMPEEEKIRFAKEAVDTTSIKLRTQIVSAFYSSWFQWPLDPSYLVKWCAIGDEDLTKVCLEAMSELKSDEIRRFALDRLEKGFDPDIVCMLIRNFEAGDEDILIPMLYDIKIDDEETTGWHAIGHVILDDERLPDPFFYWIYESTLCSFCRESAVERLMKKGDLPEGFLEECLWDADLDIRRMAEAATNG